ncbi:MAG: hypothetical protein ACYDCO_23195 [Armatimonadota bacterium]
MARNEPLSKGEKRLLIAFVILVLVIGGVGYGFHSINVNPVVNIPTPPPMPNPNARDLYVAAQGLQVTNLTIGTGPSAYTMSIDDIYETIQAGKIVPNPKQRSLTPKLVDMQALMVANAPVFNMVRQGFACEYREVPMRSFSQPLPHLSKMRALARTMMADGEVKCASGNWDGGAERFIDILRLGNDLPRGGVLISGLVGVAVQSIGRAVAWDTVDHVSAAGAKRAARRLEEIATTRVPYADILQEEKFAGQAGLLEVFNMPRWRTEMLPKLADSGSGPTFSATSLRIQLAGKRTIMANYTRYMDVLIANERNPSAAKPPPVPTDPVSSMIVPTFAKARARYVAAESENNRLLLAYALRAYKLEHGAYPNSLNALVPAYLKALPADPTAASGKFDYTRTGNTYTLGGAGTEEAK